MGEATITRAFPTLDCARKLRVHYLLPGPLTSAVLDQFPPGACTIEAFSKLVQGAKDHLRILLGTHVAAGGALGDARLVATFSKLEERPVAELVADFEACLARAGYGEVHYTKGPLAG